MTLQLPPLNALRAFESAARHLSISRAARELFVTPAAVSHQVKSLEAFVGTALFVRRHRALALTEAGATLLPGLRAGFAQLTDAVAQLHAQQSDRPLTVSANISFCSKWLIPRLDDFRGRHPDIDIRLDASNALVDFASDDVDVAVRYGGGVYPGLVSHRLWDAQVFPVCSPSLASAAKPLATPADLRHHTLLHPDWFSESDTWLDWRSWLLSAGITDIDPHTGLQFNQTTLAIQAAIEGQGVALANRMLVADDLAAGRLIKPFELSLDMEFTFYLVYPETTAQRPALAAFRDWLLAAVAGESNRQK
jgi:LysR family glycine cleavage system transcriptional activator